MSSYTTTLRNVTIISKAMHTQPPQEKTQGIISNHGLPNHSDADIVEKETKGFFLIPLE